MLHIDRQIRAIIGQRLTYGASGKIDTALAALISPTQASRARGLVQLTRPTFDAACMEAPRLGGILHTRSPIRPGRPPCHKQEPFLTAPGTDAAPVAHTRSPNAHSSVADNAYR